MQQQQQEYGDDSSAFEDPVQTRSRSATRSRTARHSTAAARTPASDRKTPKAGVPRARKTSSRRSSMNIDRDDTVMKDEQTNNEDRNDVGNSAVVTEREIIAEDDSDFETAAPKRRKSSRSVAVPVTATAPSSAKRTRRRKAGASETKSKDSSKVTSPEDSDGGAAVEDVEDLDSESRNDAGTKTNAKVAPSQKTGDRASSKGKLSAQRIEDSDEDDHEKEVNDERPMRSLKILAKSTPAKGKGKSRASVIQDQEEEEEREREDDVAKDVTARRPRRASSNKKGKARSDDNDDDDDDGEGYPESASSDDSGSNFQSGDDEDEEEDDEDDIRKRRDDATRKLIDSAMAAEKAAAEAVQEKRKASDAAARKMIEAAAEKKKVRAARRVRRPDEAAAASSSSNVKSSVKRKRGKDKETGAGGAEDCEIADDHEWNESLDDVDEEISEGLDDEEQGLSGEDNEDLEDAASGTVARRSSSGIVAAARAGRSRSRRRKVPKPSMEERILLMHPELADVWSVLENTERPVIPELCEQPSKVTIKLLPFQREGVYWLQHQEESRVRSLSSILFANYLFCINKFNGGILADEMGMGKTIQLISLLVTKPGIRPNLILTPTVAILQWFAELQQRTVPDSLKVTVFHGNNREVNPKKLAEFDVVLSTYAIIENLWRKQQHGTKRKGETVKEKSILHSIEWGRVILDEAHAIKDRSCSTARGVFNLKCRYKWSLSGTPLQNRVGELYSLIRFLNADPFSFYFCKSCPCKSQNWSFSNRKNCDICGHISHQHFCWWNAEILKPIQKYGCDGLGRVAFEKLRLLLDNIMLRRTKVERAEDLGLPPRIVTIRRDVFNDAEEELYESLYTDSARQFSTYVAANTVLNNYASIFSLLSRMRLAVNHPDLVTTKLQIKSNEATETIICGICQEEAEDPIITKCKHVYCREDIRSYIESSPEDESKVKCPTCHKTLSVDLSQVTYDGKGKGKDAARSSIINYIDMTNWRSSTKIEALVEELTALQREDSTLKSIVFSQFVAFLDLVMWRLSRAGFSCVKLDGRMGPESRDEVIRTFSTDPTVTVFLVSLKAGGVALNLTEASRVFILDPWWNPAVEDQAFDRIHRLGQTRPIKITRLIIENSIESRIIQLQEKKKTLFESTVGKDVEALAKLSSEDLQFLFTL